MTKTKSDFQARKGTNGILGILLCFFNWRESLIEVEENKLFFLSLRYSIVLFIDTFAFTLGQKISACCYRYDFYHFIFCQKAAAAIAKEGAQYLV